MLDVGLSLVAVLFALGFGLYCAWYVVVGVCLGLGDAPRGQSTVPVDVRVKSAGGAGTNPRPRGIGAGSSV